MYCIVLCNAWYWGILGCQSFCDTSQKRHKFTPIGGPPCPHYLSLNPYPKRVIVDRCCQQYKLNYTIKRRSLIPCQTKQINYIRTQSAGIVSMPCLAKTKPVHGPNPSSQSLIQPRYQAVNYPHHMAERWS